MPTPPYSFEVLSTDGQLLALEREWCELFERSRTRNPFVHPAWMISWFRHFVPDAAERLVLAVRREGELVALAPLYRHSYGLGSASCRTLQLAGQGSRSDPLTEMSEILVAPDEQRRALRALLHHLADETGGWDWLGLTLAPQQGWFENEWLPEHWRRRGANVVHKGVRPFVVMELPESRSELLLKRNMKEALRKSRTRLEREGRVETTFLDGGALPAAIETVVDLHRRRAELAGHLPHDDYFRDRAACTLVRGAGAAWAARGNAAVALLALDGVPIAGRLLLQANRTAFLSVSGSEPEYWRLGASVTLTAAAIGRAIDHGDELVNFSSSPDSAKLRWSEQLEFQHEFLVVAPFRRSRALFSAWWQLLASRQLARSRRRVVDQLAVRRDGESRRHEPAESGECC
jgi:CelD/BcsL family acetyltransferase involved in cellulose biosynthesis